MLNSHFKNTLFFWLSQPPLQTSRIAIMYDVIINGEVRRTVSGLASKSWLGAWKGRYAWASAAQFLSHNSAATPFFSMVST